MAKTLAEILLGEDMEGDEVFCDDVYNNLKNHFRDDYGGIPCALLSEEPGMIVSDTHDDKLYHRWGTVAAIYNEDAEGADDSGNWAQTDCNMVLTNDAGGGAGGSDNYYTITETNATQRISRVLAGLTVGHVYKCSIYIKDGTGTWAGAVLRIMNNALAVTIEFTNLASAADWTEYTVSFTATEINNQIAIDLALAGGLTAKLDNISVGVICRMILQEQTNVFIVDPGGGGHYTTIQAALDGQASGGELFLIAPSDYTDDTINFTANDQCVVGMGMTPQADVHAADAAICNFGAFTGCRIENMKLRMTDPTTAKDMITGSGSLRLRWCHIEVNVDASGPAGADQPTCIDTTGNVIMTFGSIVYTNSKTDGDGATAIKAAVRIGAGADVELRRVNIDIDGSGQSLLITSAYGIAGVVSMYRCNVDVNDDASSNTVGLAYTNIAGGAHEFMGNWVHVDNSTINAVGIYLINSEVVRSMYNHIHVTSAGGTAYSFDIAATASLTSQLDDIVAANGRTGVGTYVIASSEDDGDFTVSSELHMLDDAPVNFGALGSPDGSIRYDEATNDALIFGLPLGGTRYGLIICDQADVGVDFVTALSLSVRTEPWIGIVDLNNDSLFEFGFYADDVGLLTVPANPLREQMLYNADFGVWSLSGLASKTTGAQSDYEIGVAIYNEDAEGADDSGNWVKTDCNMALTNDPGGGAGGSNNYYTITETNATQRITRLLAGLTVGHIYKCSIYIKNGTGNWASATLDIMDNALANVIGSTALATEAAWAGYSVIFEATEVNNQIAINLALGGGLTAKLDDIRVIEVGPGCFGANDYGPDTWTKTSTLDLLRVQNDATHCRGLYGIEVTKGANGAEYLNAFGRIYDKEAHYKLFRYRTVSLGCWVYSVTAADNVKLQLNDSDGTTESVAHCPANVLTWMEIARTCGATITSFTPRILFDGATADVAYVSQPTLVFGASIGEGNYRPRQQELIWLEKYIPSNELDGLVSQSSSGGWTDLNVEADSDAMLPKGAKAVRLVGYCQDSTSVGASGVFLTCRGIAANCYFCDLAGIANDKERKSIGTMPCNAEGDFQYFISATGPNTFDINSLRYNGVQVN